MEKLKMVGYFRKIEIGNIDEMYNIYKLSDIVALNEDDDVDEYLMEAEMDEVARLLPESVLKTLHLKESDPYKASNEVLEKLSELYIKEEIINNKTNLSIVNNKFEHALCETVFYKDDLYKDVIFKVETIKTENAKEKKETKENDKKEYPIKEIKEIMPFKNAFDTIKQYVLCQDEPIKKVLYSIYNNNMLSKLDLTDEEKRKKKQNVLITGDTGTGKTELVMQISKLLQLPLVIEDMTRFTEAGYVGADVESIYTHLLLEAGNDLELAQRGILVLDEFDKLASTTKDNVSRDGVQNSLLKLLDGGKQIYQSGRSGIKNDNVFDTTNLTIIALGAFEGLDKIVEARVKKGNKKTIGFSYNEEDNTSISKYPITDDYVEYGENSQIIGRLHTKVTLNPLNEENMIYIQKTGKTSITNLNKKCLELLGINLIMTDDYYEESAKLAKNLRLGVRGLNTIVDNSLEDAMINVFNSPGYKELIVTGETIHNNKVYTLK